MKKGILILSLLLIYHFLQAQKFDKGMLYGKWIVTSSSMNGHPYSMDSLTQLAARYMNKTRMNSLEKKTSHMDSLTFITNTNNSFTAFANSKIKFTKKGEYKMDLIDNNAESENGLLSGLYVWINDSTVTTYPRNSKTAMFSFHIISENTLELATYCGKAGIPSKFIYKKR